MLVLALPPHDNHIIILVMAVNPRHRDLRPFPQAGGAHKTFHFVCSMNRTASERLVNLLNQFLEAQQDCCDSKGAGIGGRVPKPYKTLKGFLASQGTTCWATWFGQSRAPLQATSSSRFPKLCERSSAPCFTKCHGGESMSC